ncbi:hypothetical protein VKT23_020581 [Stygiomarasmius scandens]|uniref:Uncharacterized protein n=1 Tax=Marasmiellus scandens TaxID=2682957 RepID=A0ABR1IIR5_9AGAR
MPDVFIEMKTRRSLKRVTKATTRRMQMYILSLQSLSSQVGLPDTQPQRQQPPNRPTNSPAAAAPTSRERPRSSDQLPTQKPLSPSNLPRSSQGQLHPPLQIILIFVLLSIIPVHQTINLCTLAMVPSTRQK